MLIEKLEMLDQQFSPLDICYCDYNIVRDIGTGTHSGRKNCMIVLVVEYVVAGDPQTLELALKFIEGNSANMFD